MSQTLDAQAIGRLQDLARSVAREGENPLADMVAIFVRDSIRRVEECNESWQRQDMESARRAAHTLKGAAATIGALHVSRLAAEVETAIKAGAKFDPEAVERLRQALPVAHAALETVAAAG